MLGAEGGEAEGLLAALMELLFQAGGRAAPSSPGPICCCSSPCPQHPRGLRGTERPRLPLGPGWGSPLCSSSHPGGVAETSQENPSGDFTSLGRALRQHAGAGEEFRGFFPAGGDSWARGMPSGGTAAIPGLDKGWGWMGLMGLCHRHVVFVPQTSAWVSF